MKLSIFIDPGIRGCGVAAYLDDVLVDARYISAIGGAPHPWLEVVDPIGVHVRGLVEQWSRPGDIVSLFVEVPKVYDSAYQKGDQRDLIKLAIAAGGIAAELRLPTAFAEPWAWKGQVPKDVMQRRASEQLSPEEAEAIKLPTKSLAHNVWDAVAMGLHFHGRI